jgi:hydroxyacylglutathione hydrolase
LRCNCSVFGDEASGEAIVVDPGDDIADVLAIVAKHSLTVKAIVITHAHIDHIGGAQKLKEATGAPVHMNANDRELSERMDLQAGWVGVPVPEVTDVDVFAKEGDTLNVGATVCHILETPGHTQGSLSVWIPAEKKVIAGDTLFRDSIGRTDLPGGDGAMIIRSIEAKLMTLPEDTVVIAGHGMNTTIGREKRLNPFLRA